MNSSLRTCRISSFISTQYCTSWWALSTYKPKINYSNITKSRGKDFIPLTEMKTAAEANAMRAEERVDVHGSKDWACNTFLFENFQYNGNLIKNFSNLYRKRSRRKNLLLSCYVNYKEKHLEHLSCSLENMQSTCWIQLHNGRWLFPDIWLLVPFQKCMVCFTFINKAWILFVKINFKNIWTWLIKYFEF